MKNKITRTPILTFPWSSTNIKPIRRKSGPLLPISSIPNIKWLSKYAGILIFISLLKRITGTGTSSGLMELSLLILSVSCSHIRKSIIFLA